MIPQDIGALIEKYLDDTISPDEFSRLETWLKAGMVNINEFVEQVDVHVGLERALASLPEISVLPESGKAISTDAATVRQTAWSRFARPLAVAAALMIVAGVVFMVQREPGHEPGQAVASVLSVTGADVSATGTDNRQRGLEKGATLHSGDRIIAGAGCGVVVRVDDGSDVDLDQNSGIELCAKSDRLSLKHREGRIYCTVAKKAGSGRPFAVGIGSQGTVLAMGTAFEVSGAAGLATVAVDEGRVRIEGAGGVSREAGQLQAVTVDQLGKLGEPEYVPAYSIASWKFRQALVPDGTIIFSEDFEKSADGHLAKQTGPTVAVAEGKGVNGGACAVFTVGPGQGTMKLLDGIRLKHWEMAFDFLVEGPIDGYVGPSFGVPGSPKSERFCTIAGRDGNIDTNVWIRAVIVARGNSVKEKWNCGGRIVRDVEGHISDQYAGCFDELGVKAASEISTRIRIDNIAIRKIAAAPYEHVLFHTGFDDGDMSSVRLFKGGWRLAGSKGTRGDCIVMDWQAGQTGAVFMNCDLKNRDFTMAFNVKTPTAVGYVPVISISTRDLNECVDMKDMGGGFPPGGMIPDNDWCRHVFSVKGGKIRHVASYKGALFYDRRAEIDDGRPYVLPGVVFVRTKANCQVFLDDVVVTTPAE
ncbi:MAG: hypothetical protein C0404_14615 [Verrucomicrobia bacterium]|nr:hypothetical protein [Verrucomicrobiota bacterium]